MHEYCAFISKRRWNDNHALVIATNREMLLSAKHITTVRSFEPPFVFPTIVNLTDNNLNPSRNVVHDAVGSATEMSTQDNMTCSKTLLMPP